MLVCPCIPRKGSGPCPLIKGMECSHKADGILRHQRLHLTLCLSRWLPRATDVCVCVCVCVCVRVRVCVCIAGAGGCALLDLSVQEELSTVAYVLITKRHF